MISFIVILVALLVERFFDWSHLRNWKWYGACELAVLKKFPGGSPLFILAGAILPLVATMWLLQYFFSDIGFGLIWPLVQLAVLLYCFGPKNLWADAFASISSLANGNAESAAETLKTAFNLNSTEQPDALQQALISQIVIAANQRIFAVIFWFGLLGLPGALLYRLVSVSAEATEGSVIGAAARTCQEVLDWIPVRLLTFLFALGGNFTRVLACWRQRVMLGLEGNELLMTECGLAAITNDGEKMSGNGVMERNAVSLLDRVFVLVLVAALILSIVL